MKSAEGHSGVRRALCALVLAGAWALVALVYGATAQTVELCLFCAILLHLSLADIDRRVIPNEDLLAACAVRGAYLAGSLAAGAITPADVGFYLLSGLVVLAVLLLTILAADHLLGTESMGGGDLKLLAVCALYVGWLQILPLLFVACLLGICTSLPQLLRGGGEPGEAHVFPFGPSIALACLLTLLVGGRLAAWLLG